MDPELPAAEELPEARPVEQPTVGAIQIKLSPFWPKDPALWFAQIEAQFTTRGITASRIKFDYMVWSLSPTFAIEVRDLLLSPLRDQPYETLKRELTNRTSLSEQRRLQQLLTVEELGDRKPTQVLRCIQQLLGDKATTMDESFMRELFLQRLPNNVRMVITPSAAALNLEALAQLADQIVETSPTTTIAATNTPDQLLTAQVSELTRRLEDLSTQMAKVVNSFRRSRSQSPARQRPPPLTPVDSTAVADNLCWYHRKFGDDAKKCQSPCQKSGNVMASR